MSIADNESRLLDELSLFQDWTERYEYVISLGKKLAPLDESHKTTEKLIKGCQSQVWLHASNEGKNVYYFADSDSVIVKGLIALFIRVLDGAEAEEILKADLSFIEKTGLKEHLASTRANALNLMAAEMKKYALQVASGQD